MAQYNEFPNIMQRLSTLTRRVRDQETAPRLYSAGIGSGGIRIYGGGSLDIKNGGDINVLAGGNVLVGNKGSINILSGGRIVSEGAAKFSGTATLKGNTTIDGNLNIQGTLSFPDGKLDGSFLKNQFHTVNADKRQTGISGNFSGEKDVATTTVSVPSWATDMYILMSGTAYMSNSDVFPSRGYVIKCFADTQVSPGGPLFQGGTGSAVTRLGQMNSIKHVDVRSKTSVKVGARIYQPVATSGAVGDASFYSTVIFVR